MGIEEFLRRAELIREAGLGVRPRVEEGALLFDAHADAGRKLVYYLRFLHAGDDNNGRIPACWKERTMHLMIGMVSSCKSGTASRLLTAAMIPPTSPNFMTFASHSVIF